MVIVISAFPGLGKTYAVENYRGIRLVDSDSSKFSWIYDNNLNKTDTRNPDFPQNYINNIKNNLETLPEGSIIFVSSHEDVKKAMNDSGIKFLSVYPDKNNKENHIENLRQRSTGLNDDKFISLIESKWNEWIPDRESENMDSNKYENCVTTIYLSNDLFLGNILGDLNDFYDKKISSCMYKKSTKQLMYDSTEDTVNHKKKVLENLIFVIQSLKNRATHHDDSKLSNEEKPIFDRVTPKLKNLTYGSDEYKKQLKEMDVALHNHYINNSHHPEHFVNGINGMDIIDITEMICDWIAAAERHSDGDIFKSIEINQKRFGYSDDLKNIFINTAKRINTLKMLVEDDPETNDLIKELRK